VSELQNESNAALLDRVIRTMCEDGDTHKAVEEFIANCNFLTKDDVSTVFYDLGQHGYEFQENSEVINFYHEVIEDKIAAGVIQQYAPGHPAAVYLEENRLLRSLFNQINKLDPEQDHHQFKSVFDKICKVELHYARKENQLFPCLEKHGWDSPSKNMWAFHDDIRALIKEVGIALKESNFNLVKQKLPNLLAEMSHLIGVEEQRLIPNAMSMLKEDEWKDMYIGDEEIGWMLDEKPAAYPERKEEEYVHPSKLKKPSDSSLDTDDKYHFDEGYMTPEQVNLLFKTMPLDITYVDENDRVVFYNRGEDRLFPRSKNVIGREVRYCHPPKSVDSVLRILEEFRNGTQDVADFRIFVKGRFILIRYFAVRDNDGTYRGVMEMSQDITDVKTMEGEQRLLDWD